MLPEAVKTYIHTHRQEAVDTLSKLIGFPSVATPQPQDGFPYGKPAAEALDFMLEQLSALGMTCTNYDYHMGAADWDDTLPPHLGILCHLDVVPVVQANWTSDPFTAEIRNDRIYGRGAIDDKGPAVSVLFALRAIREAGIPLRKNVRFLLGCNEENGSTDLAYYLAHAAMPPQVFTPDGSYPIIHLEKGMLRLEFTKQTADPIVRFSAGTAPNAVPADASVSLSAAFCGAAKQGSQITCQGNKLAYKGVAAHASTPESGDNAITGLLTYLGSDAAFADCKALAQLFPHGCTDGSGLGIACADTESGALTCICSMLHVENGMLTGCVDIRFPVCTTKEAVLEQVQAAFEMWQKAKAGLEIAEKSYKRVKNLADQGVMSAQKLDEVTAQRDAAIATEKAAKAQYDMAKNGAEREDKAAAAALVDRAKGAVAEVESYIKETYLIAQTAGEVSEIFPKVGELVGTGAPIMNIAILDDMWVTFNVREDLLQGLTMGTEFEAFVPALDKNIRLKVNYMKDLGTYAAWKATKTTGQFDLKTFEVKALPQEKVEGLRPGMSVILKK